MHALILSGIGVNGDAEVVGGLVGSASSSQIHPPCRRIRDELALLGIHVTATIETAKIKSCIIINAI